MSRLLHAAARGARVQSFKMSQYTRVYKVGNGVQSKLYWKLASDEDCYIHPDDAHLQYGPISTALREIALTGDLKNMTTPYLTIGVDREDSYRDSNNDQRCVFLLILAEALADEGM